MRRIPRRTLGAIFTLIVACLFAAELAQDQCSAQAPKAEPWSPPAVNAPPSQPNAPSGSLDPAKLPDILGVHLGMDPKAALALVHAHYPKDGLNTYNTNMYTFPAPVFQGTSIIPADPHDDDFSFLSTLPPEKQAVWRVKRVTKGMHVSRDTLFAALRAKYGKETVAIAPNSNDPASSDSQTAVLLWLFDESGRRLPLPNTGIASVRNCWNVPESPGTHYLLDEATGKTFTPAGWCGSSFVGVQATINSLEPIIEMVITDMVDVPLARRTSHSTAVWYKAEAERARIKDLEKAQQAKPVL